MEAIATITSGGWNGVFLGPLARFVIFVATGDKEIPTSRQRQVGMGHLKTFLLKHLRRKATLGEHALNNAIKFATSLNRHIIRTRHRADRKTG